MGQFCEKNAKFASWKIIKKLTHRKVIAVLRKNINFGGF